MHYWLVIISFLLTINVNGQKLTKFQKDVFASDGTLQVLEGMMDENGKVVIPPIFEFIWPFQNDTISFARRQQNSLEAQQRGDGNFVAITSGGFIYFNFPANYVVESYSVGLFKVFDTRRNLYGFIKSDGNVAIRPQFTQADDFKEGLAAVEISNRKGVYYNYINLRGREEFSFRFQNAYGFQNGKALVELSKGQFGIINKSGNITNINGNYLNVFNPSEGYCITNARKSGRLVFGFVKTNGQIVLEPQHEFIDNFNGGTATFFSNGKAGMIDTSGNIVIEPRYDELYRFDQNFYIYETEDLKGLMTLNGEEIFPPVYSEISYFVNGLCPVRKNQMWGLCNIDGKLVVPCKYSGFKRTNAGWEMIIPDDWLMVINKKDTLVLPKYNEVSDFFGQISAVRKDELWGFVNLHGEEAVEPMFDEIVQLNGQLFMCRTPIKNDTKPIWSLVNNKGQFLKKDHYIDFAGFSNGFAAVKTFNGWGFINQQGEESILPKFEEVRNFSEGFAAVVLNDEWGIIDRQGQWAIAPYNGTGDKSRSTSKIRESNPLYRMGIIGDVNKGFFTAVDLLIDKSEREPLCYRVNGGAFDVKCQLLTKRADNYNPEKDKNTTVEWLLRSGATALFNDKGIELH